MMLQLYSSIQCSNSEQRLTLQHMHVITTLRISVAQDILFIQFEEHYTAITIFIIPIRLEIRKETYL